MVCPGHAVPHGRGAPPLLAPGRSAAAPGAGWSRLTTVGGGRPSVGAGKAGAGAGREVRRGACTVAAGRGLVVVSATPSAATERVTGGTTGAWRVGDTGSGTESGAASGAAEVVVSIGAETTGNDTTGGGTAGTETRPADRASGRGCVVITSIVTRPPARAREPAAASRRGQRRGGGYCQCLAWCGTARPGSAGSSSGVGAGALDGWACAVSCACLAAAASAPTRSRRARSSSIVKIWLASQSSTSRYV